MFLGLVIVAYACTNHPQDFWGLGYIPKTSVKLLHNSSALHIVFCNHIACSVCKLSYLRLVFVRSSFVMASSQSSFSGVVK